MRSPRFAVRLLALCVVASSLLMTAGCSSTDQDRAEKSPGTTSSCDPGALDTLTKGTLTVGAGEPFAPYYIGQPNSGKGFESALVYAVADRLGYPKDHVKWVTVTFDQMIAPGIKPFDFAAYQATITKARKNAVDFSSPYRTSRQGVLVVEGGKYAKATRIADLKGARIGVTAAQTSLATTKAAFGKDAKIVPFSAAGDGMQALDNGSVDAMVMDVDQGVAAASQYYPDTTVIGTLPPQGAPEQYGLVLDLDSPLTPCVSAAVNSLTKDGTLKTLQTTWLKSDDIPELR